MKRAHTGVRDLDEKGAKIARQPAGVRPGKGFR